MDVEGIAPGADFVTAIDTAVTRSDVVLVVIGAEWIDCRDVRGRRRIDDPEDFVRLEIASALKYDKVVIPVLVQGAAMPSEAQLPRDIDALARRQATTLNDASWDSDLARLLPTLQHHVKPQLSVSGTRTLLRRVLGKPIPLAALVLLGAAWLAWQSWRHAEPPQRQAAVPQVVEIAPANNQAATSQVLPRQPEAQLRASASALDFGTAPIGAAQLRNVRISNPSSVTADIHRIGFAGAAQDDYAFERRCDVQELAPNTDCELAIHFQPSSVGAREALLSVEYTSRSSPLIVKLWGNGISASTTDSNATSTTPKQ